MTKLGLVQRVLTKIISFIVGFLSWFILLVRFFGDVTIWILKRFLKTLVFAFKKIHLDLLALRPVIQLRRLINHPIIAQDRSFKAGLITIFLLIIASWYVTRDLPNPKKLENRELPQTTKIYDRNGELLFNVYTDQNRTLVPIWEIPDNLIKATIANKDKDFDVYGIVRAFRKTVFEGNVQGGSTITQQLVKSAFLTPERTISRKIKELYLAFRVEMAFPKDKILEMYINQVPYGGTAWGAAAAAEQYFGKNVKDLTLAESALLAGLPAAPSYYSPFGQ